jgi:hypothetical protein
MYKEDWTELVFGEIGYDSKSKIVIFFGICKPLGKFSARNPLNDID